MTIRDNAVNCEAKKHGYRQTQDGVVVSFVLHPQEVPDSLATASLGTRYMLALVEIGDDEQPVPSKRTWEELKASQQAGIFCNDPAFQKFLNEGIRTSADRKGGGRAWSKPVTTTDEAAEAVRYLCAVNSRADLDKGNSTGDRWNELVSMYRGWQQSPGVVG